MRPSPRWRGRWNPNPNPNANPNLHPNPNPNPHPNPDPDPNPNQVARQMEARNERLRRNQLEPQDMQVLIASALNSVDGVSDVSKVDGAIAPTLTPTPTPTPTLTPTPTPTLTPTLTPSPRPPCLLWLYLLTMAIPTTRRTP